MARILNSFLLAVMGAILAAVITSIFFPPDHLNGAISFLAIAILSPVIWFPLFFAARWLDTLPTKTALLIILGLSFCLRLAWLRTIRNEQVSDFAIYQELSKALVGGKGYTLTGPAGTEDLEKYLGSDKQLPYTTAYRAPGVPFWGAFLFKIFGERTIAYLISNLVLSVGITWLIYIILAKDPFWARRAALLWALYPPAVMAVNLFGTETIFTFFLLLTAFFINRLKEDSPIKYPFIGVLLAWTALIRSMLVPLTGGLMMAIVSKNGWRKSIWKIGIALFFILITLSPWIFRNWRIFGRVVPVCTSEGEFLGRHTTSFVPEPLKDDKWWGRFNAWREMANEVDRAREGYFIAADNWILMLKGGLIHTFNCLWLGLRSTFSMDHDFLFWSTRRSYGQYSVQESGPRLVFSQKASLIWRWFTNAFYLLLILGALVGSWTCFKKRSLFTEEQLFLTVYFFFFFAAHILVVGMGRYHFPIMPVIVMLAALGWKTFNGPPVEKCGRKP